MGHPVISDSRPVPTLALVLPTRNARRYVTELILSLLDVNLDETDLEIIVSDNSDQDKRLGDLPSDPRLKVVSPERLLPMARNWEFALESTSAHWVTFVGSDDAAVPGAIRDLVSLLESTEFDVVLTQPGFFQESALAVETTEPSTGLSALEFTIESQRTKLVDLRRKLPKARWSLSRAQRLPMPYCQAVVRRSVLKEVLSRQGGDHLIRSPSPDLFLGWAIASVRDRALLIGGGPYFISGSSRVSNGLAISGAGNQQRAAEFAALSVANPLHGAVSQFGVGPSIMLEVLDPCLKTAPLRGDKWVPGRTELGLRLALQDLSLPENEVQVVARHLGVPLTLMLLLRRTSHWLLRKVWVLRRQLDKLWRVVRGDTYISLTQSTLTSSVEAAVLVEKTRRFASTNRLREAGFRRVLGSANAKGTRVISLRRFMFAKWST